MWIILFHLRICYWHLLQACGRKIRFWEVLDKSLEIFFFITLSCLLSVLSTECIVYWELFSTESVIVYWECYCLLKVLLSTESVVYWEYYCLVRVLLSAESFVIYWEHCLLRVFLSAKSVFVLVLQYMLTIESAVPEARDIETQGVLFQQLLGLADFLLDGYKSQLVSLQQCPRRQDQYNQLHRKYEQERDKLISPLSMSHFMSG